MIGILANSKIKKARVSALHGLPCKYPPGTSARKEYDSIRQSLEDGMVMSYIKREAKRLYNEYLNASDIILKGERCKSFFFELSIVPYGVYHIHDHSSAKFLRASLSDMVRVEFNYLKNSK